MKRTTKRYVITTSAVNCYLFRMLTEGGDLSQYANNPLLLWMHIRATENNKAQILPLGNAVELKLEGDAITCFLEFDESDPFAMQIYNKYENGTLNMLSAGAKPLEFSDAPELKLPGQEGYTITKWILVEVSCVDMGANPEAHACQLYDADDKKIEMANLTSEGMVKLFNSLATKQNEDIQTMKIITLSAPVASAILLHLKLTETATEVEVQKAVADMVQLNLSQATKITTLTTEKETSDAKIIELSGKLNTKEVEVLLAEGQRDRKITVEEGKQLVELTDGNYDKIKKYLDGRASAPAINLKGTTTTTGDSAELEKLTLLSWDAMDKAGTLPRLKTLSMEVFKQKYTEKFGTEYKEK